MTETPPTDAPGMPAEPKVKRTRLRLAAFIVGVVIAGLVAVALWVAHRLSHRSRVRELGLA